MSRFNEGWVKAYRKIYSDDKQNNYFYGNGQMRDLFMLLICWANREDGKTSCGFWNEEIVVKRGQLITSMKELEKACGLTTGRVRGLTKGLTKNKMINVKTDKRGTLVTICNYDRYQPHEQSANNQLTNSEQSANNLLEKQEGKNSNTSFRGICRLGSNDPQFGPSEFVKLFEECCPTLPKIRALSERRKKAIKARLKEEPSADYWRKVFTRLEVSSFCHGQNDRGWEADIDFITRSESHIRILEGKYDDRIPKAQDGGFCASCRDLGSQTLNGRKHLCRCPIGELKGKSHPDYPIMTVEQFNELAREYHATKHLRF